MKIDNVSCQFCNSKKFKVAFTYSSPPRGEVKINLSGKKYNRQYVICNFCGHYLSKHKLDLRKLYSNEYMEKTYGQKIHATFNKIISLPTSKSDNYKRIKRIKNIVDARIKNNKIDLLDIGSGLGVFPYSVKQIGWNCCALDPDKRSVAHIKNNLKIKAFNKDFLKVKNIFKNSFHVITLNKVLEHVLNPTEMLNRTKKFLDKKGIVYIEVPDGTEAAKKGKLREEFFIDHIHVFSLKSLTLMIKNSGFNILNIKRLKEPSGKFTLFAFIKSN